KGYGKHARRQRNGADADVAESRVVLLVAGGADRLSAVGNARQVGIAGVFPERGGLFDLLLPGRRSIVRVERLEQGAWNPADRGSVGHEAISDPAAIGPFVAERRVEQDSVFQRLRPRTEGTVPRRPE